MYPGFFFAIFWLGRTLGLPYHAVVLPAATTAFAFVTSLLPVSVYYFIRAMAPVDTWHRRIAVIAAALCAANHKLVVIGGQLIVNGFVSALTIGALAAFIFVRNAHGAKVALPAAGNTALLCVSGMVLGFTTYVRCDQLVLLVPAFLAILHPRAVLPVVQLGTAEFRASLVCTVVVAFGFIAAAVLAGALDFAFYGHWFASPARWFITNVLAENSAAYGTLPFWYFFDILFIKDSALCGLACISVCGLFSHFSKSTNEDKTKLQVLLRAGFVAVFVLLVYSRNPHKEVRFIHDGLVFSLIFVAGGIVAAWDRLGQLNSALRSELLFTSVVIVLLVVEYPRLTATDWFLGVANGNKAMPDAGAWDAMANLNEAMQYVGSAGGGATGVMVIANTYITMGGFTSLHKAIPFAMVQAKQARMQLHMPDSTKYCTSPFLMMADKNDLKRDSKAAVKSEAYRWVAGNEDFNYLITTEQRARSTLPELVTGASPLYEKVHKIGLMTIFKRSKKAPVTSSCVGVFQQVAKGWDCEGVNRWVETSYSFAKALGDRTTKVRWQVPGPFKKSGTPESYASVIDGSPEWFEKGAALCSGSTKDGWELKCRSWLIKRAIAEVVGPMCKA
jgi:hypothetical protein